jgi:carbamoyltransferase
MKNTLNILAINPGHNGSVALLENGELIYYAEEERLSRQKYDGNPFRAIVEACQMTKIDVVVLGGTSAEFPSLTWTGEDPYYALVRKYWPNVQRINLGNDHHLGHAAGAFYNSGFEEAAAVVIDGAGSRHQIQLNEEGTMINSGYETESIYDCSIHEDDAMSRVKNVFKSYGGNADTQYILGENLIMDHTTAIVKSYEAVSDYLGFGYIEAGKTMGLAPYGKKDENIPQLFRNGRGDKNVFLPNYPAGATVDQGRNEYLRIDGDPTEWHNDPDKVTDVAKNLAWQIQNDTQELVCQLIEKAVELTGKKNIVISGGYGLNCVANYYYLERFPDLNIWIDPVSHDGGTAIGLAKLIYWAEQSLIEPDMIEEKKLDTLYLGKHEDVNDIMNSLSELLQFGVTIKEEVEYEEIAKLISEKNIVALHQGQSEAGPRALGNRSILYDPRDPNGKDEVNKVKGREWFRPFAGSMLHEHFEEWFETRGLEETPYMMYAMDFKLEKHGEVPAITHVDGTCRIQTVKKEQNEHYYNLISAFNDITGVPILFNTSFNLAGEPLVETLQDAINTILNSDIKYLYHPEYKLLFEYDKNLKEFNTNQNIVDKPTEEEFFEADDEE